MQVTSESVQRWVRVILYYVWGGLGTIGVTTSDGTKALVASIVGFIATAAWTKWGSSVSSMLTEVAKVDGVDKVTVQVNADKVNPTPIAAATPNAVVVKSS